MKKDMPESTAARSVPLVLVVDDDLTIRLLARQSLELAGFAVAEAEDGAAALAAFEKLRPDAVLLDVIIPAPDGFAVCRTLRRLPEGENLPVLMMTGLEDTESINRAYEAGATDFVTKPINWLILGHRVRYMLRAGQAFTAVREGERFLTSIFSSIQDGLIILDANLNIVRVNPATEQWYAHAKPMEGKKCFQVCQGCHTPCQLCPAQRTLAEGVTAHEVLTKRGPAGEAIGWLDVFTFPLVDLTSSRTKGVILCLRDITSRIRGEEALRHQEEQFYQSQKMEAVGRLAGGVAHDFNNLLTVIMGYCEIMELHFGPGALPMEVSHIKKATEQAAALTRQLLAFSRRQPVELQALNLNAVVADMGKLLQRLLGEDIELRCLPDPGLARVRADKGQIEQVLMNLAINAADAMPAGGCLTISTENQTLPSSHPRVVLERRSGPFVCLTVADNGAGMDQETRARIFDPFFTTKGPARGTGLGLSTVYGIVRQHEGWIEVDSEPGMGATFRLYLPILENQVESPFQEVAALKRLQGQGELILVVEDEEGVRGLAAQGLRENGYEVATAATAEEAQKILAGAMDAVRLIFCDVVLPDCSALELLDRVLPQHPSLPVLLTSGYTDEKSQWPLIQARGWPFLYKPYSLADLLAHVKEALESKP